MLTFLVSSEKYNYRRKTSIKLDQIGTKDFNACNSPFTFSLFAMEYYA